MGPKQLHANLETIHLLSKTLETEQWIMSRVSKDNCARVISTLIIEAGHMVNGGNKNMYWDLNIISIELLDQSLKCPWLISLV